MQDYEPIKTIRKESKYGDATFLFAESPGQEAQFVLHLIEKWGMVAGDDGGEDSAGRAKLRLQTPEEVVARAMQTAEAAFRTLREHGWIAPMPARPVEVASKTA